MTGAGPTRMLQRSLVQFLGTRVPVGREGVIPRNQGVNFQNPQMGDSRGNSQPAMIRKRLTQEEVNERRNKGLCFGCNEPYFRDHKCSMKQLYSLVMEAEEEEAGEGEEVGHYLEEEDSAPVVTLHAMNGETDTEVAQTMGLTGQFKKRMIHILVDSGSTHNLGLAFLNINPVMIMVADGRRLQSTKAVKGFTWKMQESVFAADLYVIPLKGCEMVLGINWLAQLGDVIWNFQTLNMRFIWKGESMNLQGREGRGKEELRIME